MPGRDNSAHRSATLAEILSQPETWRQCLNELQGSGVLEEILEGTKPRDEWVFAGCGTSYYLAEAAAAAWTMMTGHRARALPASELLLFPALAMRAAENVQAVVISRSGRTSEAVRAANLLSQEHRVPTLGITCAADSPLEKACNRTVRLLAADEKSMVMTRSFSSMLLALQCLAGRKSLSIEFAGVIGRLADHFAECIRPLAAQVEEFVSKRAFADYVFLGQGPFHALAREASLKITEMSCSYSQAFHTLEFRHGPKAIVSPDTCLTFFLSKSGLQAEAEVLAEMHDLGGVTIAICDRANELVRRSSDLVLELGFDGPELATLAPFIVPAQLMGFFTGVKKNLNPDEPKNLSRVVILD
ncbi:MAG TPA: SIS domain-containing protein [Candidatus Angelobacter sp.]|nr:SIS domain-containing protein [Candidatus Angelobacter sp.]